MESIVLNVTILSCVNEDVLSEEINDFIIKIRDEEVNFKVIDIKYTTVFCPDTNLLRHSAMIIAEYDND